MDVRARAASGGASWPTFKSVDTCAAEFEAYTPYYYSTYEDEDETPAKQPGQQRIMILGGGPNRIGQGIEFDYCCCHASFALRELGIESIMVNSNPETVSTDYDTSDLLFFEPLTTEDVLNICDRVEPDGVIVQFGGQTPLNLARALSNAGVPIIGTSVDTIEDAEDREKFKNMLHRLGLKQPASGIARNMAQARNRGGQGRISRRWCGRASCSAAGRWKSATTPASSSASWPRRSSWPAGQPVLIDRFLEDAIEVDVDAIADGQQVIVAGIMEHIEEAGVHSGDSACAIPPFSLPPAVVDEIRQATCALAQRLQVKGLMNIQYAVKREDGRPNVYVLEVNPRASRTVPFVSKATGMPLAKAAAKVMVGRVAGRAGLLPTSPFPSSTRSRRPSSPSPSSPASTSCSGPEMKSTGEVMGVSDSFPIAFAKSQMAAGTVLPSERQGLHQRHQSLEGARRPIWRGGWSGWVSSCWPPAGTAQRLEEAGIRVQAAEEGPGGASQRARLHDRRQSAIGHQHAQRQGCADRRGPHPRRGRLARHPLHHHARRRRRPPSARWKPCARRDDRPGRARSFCQPPAAARPSSFLAGRRGRQVGGRFSRMTLPRKAAKNGHYLLGGCRFFFESEICRVSS